MPKRAAAVFLGLGLAACATAPREAPRARPETAAPAEAEFALRPVRFADLPDWGRIGLGPAIAAFRRACAARALRDPNAPLAGGRYGGRVADWAPACAAAETTQPGAEQTFFEVYFEPAEVRGTGETRLTAYFEPIIEARRFPAPGFTAPLLTRPADMVSVDIAAFAEAYDDEALRGAPRRLTGQIVGTMVRPYPKREAIEPAPGQAFAWAHAADVYNLQIQGSGRMAFPDGAQTRAAFAAQNGYRWNSALRALRDSGALPNATWANLKAWMDQNGDGAARAALNVDPSYVFFAEEPIIDPAVGPRGAAGAPLTPMGSIAIDPAYHPYGAVLFVEGSYDGAPFRRLLVAQDTGGAIRRGPLRGDMFFGSGPEAGAAAERMNANPVRFWTFLPKGAPVS